MTMSSTERPELTINDFPDRAPYPPIEKVFTVNVDTQQAAFYLGRKPQTLRKWSCFQQGAVNPLHINGRLAWPVAQIKAVVYGETV